MNLVVDAKGDAVGAPVHGVDMKVCCRRGDVLAAFVDGIARAGGGVHGALYKVRSATPVFHNVNFAAPRP